MTKNTQTDSVEVTLKPCPFCGCEAALSRIDGNEMVGYAATFFIRCNKCGGQIREADSQNPKGGYAVSDGKSKAITAWNTRQSTTDLTTENAALKARVEELEQAARYIRPYLDWTVGPESPAYHPTMPSAVAAFKGSVGTAALKHQPRIDTTLNTAANGGEG